MKSAVTLEADARSARGIAEAMLSGSKQETAPPPPVYETIVPVTVARSKSFRPVSLYDHCWEVRVYFLFPATVKSYSDFVRRFDPTQADGEIELARCTSVFVPDAQQVIIIGLTEWKMHSPSSAGTMAHECFHAAQYILEHRGIKLNDDTSEAYAYLIDSLVRRGTILLERANSLDNRKAVV